MTARSRRGELPALRLARLQLIPPTADSGLEEVTWNLFETKLSSEKRRKKKARGKGCDNGGGALTAGRESVNTCRPCGAGGGQANGMSLESSPRVHPAFAFAASSFQGETSKQKLSFSLFF